MVMPLFNAAMILLNYEPNEAHRRHLEGLQRVLLPIDILKEQIAPITSKKWEEMENQGKKKKRIIPRSRVTRRIEPIILGHLEHFETVLERINSQGMEVELAKLTN